MLESGMAWLGAELNRCASTEVEYESQSGTFAVRAVVGRSAIETEGEYGQTIRIETIDFILPPDALPSPPRRGDIIRYKGSAYEVIQPAGEPEWRWTDPHRSAMRIHTKRSA